MYSVIAVTDMMLDRDPKDEVLKAFRLFDDDDSGKISLRNLRRVARYLFHHVFNNWDVPMAKLIF